MGVLSGVRVIEVSSTRAAQIAGMVLADLGADVIRLEGDEAHEIRAFEAYPVWHRNKRSAVRTRDAIEALASDAHLLLVDESVEAVDQSLRERHPHLIICAVEHFDVVGAPPDAVDLAHAFCGLMRTHLYAADPQRPVYHVAPAAAYGTALLAVLGAMCALYTAGATGAPSEVRVSELEGALAMLQFSIALPDAAPRGGVIASDGDPYAVSGPLVHFYQARGGEWLFLGAPTPSIWVKVCIALDRQDWLTDPEFEGAPFGIATSEGRMRLVKELGRAIGEWDADELIALLNSQGIVSARSLLPAQFMAADPDSIGRILIDVETPEVGLVKQVAFPLTFSAHPSKTPNPAPMSEPLDGPLPEWMPLAGGTASTRQRPTDIDGSRPLAGITVLDFGNFVAGPQAAKHLADLGADVIKIETPGGDPLRQIGYSFSAVNWGKREVEIDLRTEAGQHAVEDLLRRADIIIHNFRPALQQRVGISWERISALNPRAIVAQVNGWAVDGPLSERRAIDGAFQAMTGRCVGQGGDIEPRGFYGGLVDNATAMLVAAACVAALVDRQATGRGQQVATTLLGVAALVQSHRLVLTGGQAPALGRLGTDPIGRSQLARLFATSDGWIFVDADRDEDWSKLVHGGRVPADLERPSASDGAEAIADGPVARALLQWCVSMTTSQALAAFADLGVAAVPVHHLGDLPSVSRVTSSGALVAVDHPQWGALWHTGRLIRFSQPRSAVAPAR